MDGASAALEDRGESKLDPSCELSGENDAELVFMSSANWSRYD